MGPIANFHHDGFDMQRPFDAAVVIATILRPTLRDALLSVFRQNFKGRVQILVGIDKALGDRGILEAALAERPPHQAVTVLDPGYSTSVRHGGLHPDRWGGVLHTVMGYLANSQFVSYLADDNWMGPRHLGSLLHAIGDHDWAFSFRWYVDEKTRQPICVDQWESVGPGRGVFAERFGGFVDPNCMLLNKLRCEPVLRYRSLPLIMPEGEVPSDRAVFQQLRNRPWVCTGLPTSFYMIQSSDENHENRMNAIRRSLEGSAEASVLAAFQGA